eukprot:UN09930
MDLQMKANTVNSSGTYFYLTKTLSGGRLGITSAWGYCDCAIWIASFLRSPTGSRPQLNHFYLECVITFILYLHFLFYGCNSFMRICVLDYYMNHGPNY